MKQYNVKHIGSQKINIGASKNNPIWDSAEVLDNFVSPWDTNVPTRIEFRALWCTSYFYFKFKVFDTNIHIDTSDHKKENIGNSDRVEIFFRTSDKMNPYYCLEIDPILRIMDFKAKPNKNFDFDWEWPSEEIKISSYIDKDQFSVEGSISLKSLSSFDLLDDKTMEVGIFRAKYNKCEKNTYQPTWITWIDPKVNNPNFHIPSAFGKFQLV